MSKDMSGESMTSAQLFAKSEAEALAKEASRDFTRTSVRYRTEVRKGAWRRVNRYNSKEVMDIITGTNRANGFYLWQEVSRSLGNTDLSPAQGVRLISVLLLCMDAIAILKELGCVWDPEAIYQAE